MRMIKASAQAKGFFLLVLFCTVPVVLRPFSGNTSAGHIEQQSGLCPPASPARPVVVQGQKIQVPSPLEEERLVFRISTQQDAGWKEETVAALALAGNVETFRQLLLQGDSTLLRTYARYYRNRDGTRCLDPEIEDALSAHLDNPSLSSALLLFFHNNVYRGKKLFNRLLEKRPALKDHSLAGLTVKALISTNLAGIEQNILKNAVGLSSRADQRYWWLLPQIERHYFNFFVQRQYTGAIPYMRSILDETHYSLAEEPRRTHIINRHRFIYYALDKFPSSYVGDVFIQQLAKLMNRERDSFFINELKSAGEYAVKHALSFEQKEEIAGYLLQILNATRTDGGIPASAPNDHIVRTRIIKMLEKIDTETSAALLVAVLNETVNTKVTAQSDAFITQILVSLANISGEVELPVPEFLKAVGRIDTRTRFFHIPALLLKHRHPEGYSYLISQLGEILTYDADIKRVLGLDREQAFMNMFNHVIAFDEPDSLLQTRAEIDSLYQNGTLPEKLYLTASERLNELMGSESPVYHALYEEQEAAREAERKKRMAEEMVQWKQKIDFMFAEQTLPDGIKKNLHALNSSHPGQATKWLIVADSDILPYAHAALRDPEVSVQVKFRLIDILGTVGDTSSIELIIETVLDDTSGGLSKVAFLSLGQMPQTGDSFHFAMEQLKGKRLPRVQQSALAYFAFHKDMRALPVAGRFASPDVHPDVRTAALYVLARLERDEVMGTIIELLEKEQDRSRKATLLRALAELVPPEEFEFRTDTLSLDKQSEAYTTAVNIARFRHLKGLTKSSAAERLLQSEFSIDRREAVRFLIEQNKLDILRKYYPVDPALIVPPEMAAVKSESPVSMFILTEARKMGLSIEQTAEGIHFKAAQ